MKTPPLIQLEEVSKFYLSDGHRTHAVRNATLSLWPGELTLLLGPSGSGKTTILNLIAGLIEPTGGEILIFGRRFHLYSERERQLLRAEHIGFIFQSFMLIDALTVLENVALVLRFTGSSAHDARRRGMKILAQLNIAHLSTASPSALSQGEKQRVAIARAVANEGSLLLADEPTASLESAQGFEIIELLHTFAKEKNKCVVVASHDTRMPDYADRVVRIADGITINEDYYAQDETATTSPCAISPRHVSP